MRPQKPFMIERDGAKFGAPGDDFALIKYKGSVVTMENMRIRWVDWDGSRWSTKDEADIFLSHPLTKDLFQGAKVIEVLEETRLRSGGA